MCPACGKPMEEFTPGAFICEHSLSLLDLLLTPGVFDVIDAIEQERQHRARLRAVGLMWSRALEVN